MKYSGKKILRFAQDDGLTSVLLSLVLVMCLWMALIAPPGLAEDAGKGADITKKCAFKVSEGNKDKFLDGKAGTLWSPKHKDAWIGIKLPKDTRAGWLRVEWMFDPTAYELTEYDDAMSPLRTRTQADMWPNIYSMYELLPETRVIQLKLTAKDQSICRVGVYSAGELPADAQLWNPPVDKADLMVLSTHQDDELVFMGGTIPYYAVALQKPTVIVYMTNCARYRRAEALNALWKMGVRDYPDFINLKDEKVGSIEAGIKLWGGKDKVLSLVVERIRRYKPEVIVAQDLNGEYGHNQHKITARCAKYAIDAAADPSQYPESAQKYGTWQVKKLYHHLYKENTLEMDWETPMEALGGKTPLEVAKIGMKEHSSQTGAYAVKSHGTYDNSKFGLYFTTVGDDEAKNDFLEHIDPDATANYLAEHADEIEAQKAASAAELAAAAATAQAEPDDAPEPDEEEAEAPDDVGDEAMDAADDAGEGAPPEAGATESTDGGEDAEESLEGDPDEASANLTEEGPEEAPEDEPNDSAEASGNGDANTIQGQPGVQAAGQLLTAAQPTAERDGGAVLPILMIGAGVAAIGVGGWYGLRYMQGRKRRRRRRR